MIQVPQVKRHVFGAGWYETALSGAWTVNLGNGLMQEADPNGANRSATLPAAATNENVAFFCKNNADADETITFDDEDATVIGRGECCILMSDGTVWKRFGIFEGSGLSESPSNIATVAAAGSDQSGATAIAARISDVTGADAAKGVKLPTAAAGLVYSLYNNSTSPLLVYPNTSDDINDGSANAAVVVAPNSWAYFAALDAVTWAADGVSTTRVAGVQFSELRKQAAIKDALADTPGSNSLGLADAAGGALTGTETNSGGTASANESAAFEFILPDDYLAGQAITLRVRAKVSAARQVAQTVDAVVKAIGDAGLGSDICATSIQSITTSYVNYDFTITPTGLVAGDRLHCEVYLATNDTGGGTNGTPTATKIDVRYTGKP